MQAVRRRLCQSLIGLAVVASTAKAQVPLPEYAARRAALAANIDSGVVLAFVGATGALLSFETEIVAALNRDVRNVEAPGGPAPAAD